MSDDERFDQRMRVTLEPAGQDAPWDAAAAGSVQTRSVRSRMLVVAASLTLVLAGVVALTSTRKAAESEVTPATTDASQSSIVPSTLAQSSGDPTVPDGPRCTLPDVTEYDEIGTMHTVVPNTQPLDASVIVESGGPYCSGDSIVVAITVHNLGVGFESVTPRLILGGGANKYPIADLPAFDLKPNETRTQSYELTLPAAPPGDYWVGLYGFGDIAPITLANPPLCDETTLETTAAKESALGADYTFITGTNVGQGNCFVSRVLWVENIVDGVPAQVPASGVLEDLRLPPLLSHVLRPGDSVGIVVGTNRWCLDDPVVEQPIGVLALYMSGTVIPPVTVDLRDVAVQAACGVAISDWGVAQQ